MMHDVNVITSSFGVFFLAATGKFKHHLRGGEAVIGGSRRLRRMLNRSQEFLYIMLVRPNSLGSTTNISDEGFFERKQLYSQITPMQH